LSKRDATAYGTWLKARTTVVAVVASCRLTGEFFRIPLGSPGLKAL
jgi:hypothetical protein